MAEQEPDYIPKDPMALKARYHNLITKLEALDPAKLGISPAQIAAKIAKVKAVYKDWVDASDANLKAQSALRASEQKYTDAQQAYNDAVQAYKDEEQRLKDEEQEGEEWKGGEM